MQTTLVRISTRGPYLAQDPRNGLHSGGVSFHMRAQFCSGASWLGPLFQALPYVWRFCQCIRVVLDTGADAQRWNALKYATAFPAIACWGMRPRVEEDVWCGSSVLHMQASQAAVTG